MKKFPYTPLQIAVHLYAWSGLALLLLDYFTGNLSPNPIQDLEQRTGRHAITLLVLSLLCTPINTIFKWSEPIKRRRALGVYAFLYATVHMIIFVDLDFGLARSEDLWLHARGTPGSHVVVRLEKGAEPPLETIRDAATLALLYSDLKKSGKGDVIYTRRKWVKKAKGQAPGAVTVTQERSIYVTLDKTRLDGLKSRLTGRPS